jgi:hypothetical protein
MTANEKPSAEHAEAFHFTYARSSVDVFGLRRLNVTFTALPMAVGPI